MSRGAGNKAWNQISMSTPVKKFGQTRLSTDFGEKHGRLQIAESFVNVLPVSHSNI